MSVELVDLTTEPNAYATVSRTIESSAGFEVFANHRGALHALVFENTDSVTVVLESGRNRVSLGLTRAQVRTLARAVARVTKRGSA